MRIEETQHMTTEADLIQQLVAAQRAAQSTVDATLFADIDREAAYRIQAGVLAALGETPALIKTAVQPDGTGIAAPIFASRFGQSGDLALPNATLTGLEVEVGLVLGSDLSAETANADDAAIIEAIDHYFVGIEICGTRYRDRSLAGVQAGLADNMSSYGYVINPAEREAGADIDNFDVQLSLDGVELHSGPAKHSFVTVLNSFVRYAKSQVAAYPLKAGSIITTGSLCGLVPVDAAARGRVKATFGNHTVEFTLT
jgi:2-keto-4-pentenoate hydratase